MTEFPQYLCLSCLMLDPLYSSLFGEPFPTYHSKKHTHTEAGIVAHLQTQKTSSTGPKFTILFDSFFLLQTFRTRICIFICICTPKFRDFLDPKVMKSLNS